METLSRYTISCLLESARSRLLDAVTNNDADAIGEAQDSIKVNQARLDAYDAGPRRRSGASTYEHERLPRFQRHPTCFRGRKAL